jgi:hypothetical protein
MSSRPSSLMRNDIHDSRFSLNRSLLPPQPPTLQTFHLPNLSSPRRYNSGVVTRLRTGRMEVCHQFVCPTCMLHSLPFPSLFDFVSVFGPRPYPYPPPSATRQNTPPFCSKTSSPSIPWWGCRSCLAPQLCLQKEGEKNGVFFVIYMYAWDRRENFFSAPI